MFTSHLLHGLSTSGLISDADQSSLLKLVSAEFVQSDKYELDRLGTSAIDEGQSVEVRSYSFPNLPFFVSLVG